MKMGVEEKANFKRGRGVHISVENNIDVNEMITETKNIFQT